MPLRKLPAEATDADSPRAAASTPVAEVDELALAEARAAAARARAVRLRQQAEPPADEPDVVGANAPEAESDPAPRRRWRPRRPGRKALAIAAGMAIICSSLAASGYLMWHHRDAVAQRQREAEFAAAARDGIVMMMSIDPAKARQDLQRFADDTTGVFKIGFLMGAEDLVKAVEQSKISTKATVKAVAVQSMTRDSALVLVAAKSELTKPGEDKPESRSLRAVVAVQRDAGQLKIARVEFVP
jgi:Mce-associated membrane protein